MEKLLSLILKIRQQKNYSQAYLAYKVGLSQKQYSFLESGKTQFKLFHLISVANILEINPCDLLDLSGMLNNSVTSKKDKIIEQQSSIITNLQTKNKYVELVNMKLLQLA